MMKKTPDRSDSANKNRPIRSHDAGAVSTTKAEVSKILAEMANIFEILGENPFKIRSYQNAARALDNLPHDLGEMLASGDLLGVKGIGKSLFAQIEELYTTGRLGLYEEVKEKIPAGLLGILRIPGVGPKKVKVLYDKLGVTSIEDLEKAAKENKVAELAGFGARTQTRILDGIQNVKKYSERHRINKALTEAEALQNVLDKHPDVKRSLVAGSLRRRRETVKDIDIVVSAERTNAIMESFTSFERVAAVVARGETKSSVTLKSGINADLRAVKDDEFPFAAAYFTGSKEHNTEMRARAKKMGFKLNEYGLYEGEKHIECADEAAIYGALGLDYVPPELREAQGEIEAAENHTLPELVTAEDIRGILHVHTTYSDGTASVEEMARAAKEMGLEYLGIADHSQTASYAGGLTEDDVKRQSDEVREVNSRLEGFTVFHGIESDVLPDGSLDYPDDVLELFDFIVISVHQNFGMSEADMTARIIKAIENPYATVLGHPTGRLLLAREGYRVDVHALIDAAAENDLLIEINSNPHRLDLDWRYLRAAKDKGVIIAINPDSHTIDGMHDYRYGVGIARKGWLTRDNVLNSRGADGARAIFDRRRKDR
jgi:DNA polymerase (family 10)